MKPNISRIVEDVNASQAKNTDEKDHPSYPYRDRNYQMHRGWLEDISIAEEEAENGDVHAQLYCAITFDDDRVYWYRKAADQGHPEAIAMLAIFYENGFFVNKNLNKACELFEKFIAHDDEETPRDPGAFCRILLNYGCYLIGAKCSAVGKAQRLPPEKLDVERGLKLIERAADEFKHEASIIKLAGDIYMMGGYPNVPADLDKSMYWFLKGAQAGIADCAWQLAINFMTGTIPVHEELKMKWLQIGHRLGKNDCTRLLDMTEDKKPMEMKVARKRLRHLDKEKKIEKYLSTDKRNNCSNPKCNKIEGDKRFNVCAKCRQKKYCSRQCQVAHWKDEHKEECAELTKEKEQIKGYNRNAVMMYAKICFNPYCGKLQGKAEKFHICAKCKNALYCSKKCEESHYQNEHRDVCKQVVYYLEEADKLLEKLPEPGK